MKISPIIAFTAGKGGCGKTTLSVNFAYHICKAGKKVLLVDFDLSNRGSTGLFALSVKKKKSYLTLAALLEQSAPKRFSLVEVHPNYYFMPAAPAGTVISMEPYEQMPLEKLIELVRARLLEIATESGIDCIVLDCFCGIDPLTTAAVCMSDDAILINEADIVTFTGTIALHRHILEALD